jgi:hypothetical protein
MIDSMPYTLPSLEKPTVSVSNPKKLVRKVMFPHLCKVMESAGFEYVLSHEEERLTTLEASAVPSSRTSTVINITRQLDNKSKEWIWFTTVERGYSADGQECIGSGTVVEHNKDIDVFIKKIRDSEGTVTRLQLTNKYSDIYTTEYSKDYVNEILSSGKYEISPKLSMTINEAGSRSWSGMSQLEFENLDAKELIWRCKNNRCNEDLNTRFSELSTAQKYNLSQN